jgi:flagellar basal-body rod protein FlgG
MLRSLSTAASGMKAQQICIDTIANNLANVNTAGFKKSRAEFEDLLYENLTTYGASEGAGSQRPLSSEIGHGVRLAGMQKIFEQGMTKQTENPLDMVIDGDGFFQVLMPDGTYAYTRDGSFKIDADGNMVKASGYLMEPNLTVPRETRQVSVSGDGQLNVLLAAETEPQQVGTIELVRFSNPAGLEAIGHNLFRETVASGPPIVGNPGEEGFGTINQGFVEMSNVNVIEEMIGMITAQRAYEINSKAIQTSEDLLETVTNIKR